MATSTTQSLHARPGVARKAHAAREAQEAAYLVQALQASLLGDAALVDNGVGNQPREFEQPQQPQQQRDGISEVAHDNLLKLLGMGFEVEKAMAALATTSNNVDRAVTFLLELGGTPLGEIPPPPPPPSPPPPLAPQASYEPVVPSSYSEQQRAAFVVGGLSA